MTISPELKKVLRTEEEFYEDLLLGERKQNTEWCENYASAFLKAIGCPAVHRVDGNPKYRKRKRDLYTPDFVIWQDHIGENDPKDFYVDVQEITGGPWDIKTKTSPLFKNGNPVRAGAEILKCREPGEQNAQRYLINEYNPEILKAIFKPINRKSNKYGQRKRKSSRFGLVSVQSPINQIDRIIHFQKLIWSVFESLITSLAKSGVEEASIHPIMDLRNEILASRRHGLIPITASFNTDAWCFWALLGVNSHASQCIFLINQKGIQRCYQEQPDEILEWLEKLSISQDLPFVDNLEKILAGG